MKIDKNTCIGAAKSGPFYDITTSPICEIKDFEWVPRTLKHDYLKWRNAQNHVIMTLLRMSGCLKGVPYEQTAR